MTSLAMPFTPVANLKGVAARRIAETNRVATGFFRENADAIAATCQHLAQNFQRGGRLLVCGDDAQQSDVAHVVVEFMHPVVVGKRALPAMALPEIASGAALRSLPVLGREHDILMLISSGALTDGACALLPAARAVGLTTIVLCGAEPGTSTDQQLAAVGQHEFTVASTDASIVQETHEMLYHVLWELVHVFLDHRAR